MIYETNLTHQNEGIMPHHSATLEQPHFSPQFRRVMHNRAVRAHATRGTVLCAACGRPGNSCCGGCRTRGLCGGSEDDLSPEDLAELKRQVDAMAKRMQQRTDEAEARQLAIRWQAFLQKLLAGVGRIGQKLEALKRVL